MDPLFFLLVGVGALVLAGGTVTIVLVTTKAGGVAQSLALIERQVDARHVSKNELPASERLVQPLLASLRGVANRFSPGGTAARLGKQLDLAGNPASWTVDKIMGAKGVGLVAGAFLGLIFAGISLQGLLISAAAAAVVFFLPDLLLYNLGLKRQGELKLGLADALDLLTVCVEAGQGFNAGLMQIARATTGPIAGEFARVLSEIQIGKSRAAAFGAFADRTSANEIRTFVTAIIQADRLGLPLAQVLREQAKEMRTVRRQLAEEKAQKVPVKIIFPMLLFVFPALFVVIIGPGAVQIVQSFAGL